VTIGRLGFAAEGEVEPSLRPDRRCGLCVLGLGLPITENWRNRYLSVVSSTSRVNKDKSCDKECVSKFGRSCSRGPTFVELYTSKAVERLLHGRCCCAIHLLQHRRSLNRHVVMIPITAAQGQGPRTSHRLRHPHRHNSLHSTACCEVSHRCLQVGQLLQVKVRDFLHICQVQSTQHPPNCF
jgi:hypothetical protein